MVPGAGQGTPRGVSVQRPEPAVRSGSCSGVLLGGPARGSCSYSGFGRRSARTAEVFPSAPGEHQYCLRGRPLPRHGRACADGVPTRLWYPTEDPAPAPSFLTSVVRSTRGTKRCRVERTSAGQGLPPVRRHSLPPPSGGRRESRSGVVRSPVARARESGPLRARATADSPPPHHAATPALSAPTGGAEGQVPVGVPGG
jgi:hypothetical protein